MYCIHCGKQNPDGAAFCIQCGKRIVNNEIKVQQQITFAAATEELIQSAPDAAPAFPVQAPAQAAAPVTAAPCCEAVVTQPGNSAAAVQHPVQPAPSAMAEKGSLKIPLIILAALSAVGLLLFLLIPLPEAADGTIDPETPEISSGGEIPWFNNALGTLFFFEGAYTGGQELTIPEQIDGEAVTTIGAFCFTNVDNITTVILPTTLENIENRAFAGCDNLRGIFIPVGTFYIGFEAFADCTSLESISIPNTIESIEEDAFDGCSSLKFVFYDGTLEEWNTIFNGCETSDTTVFCSDGECSLEWRD